ncbi:membrane protein insertion efficiency factor YidD [Halobacteriovorax sp. GB3]|uniref:membrane protein insertion efficiency factor YidD n=1 Tax=Halobacteriovorax sp. GB3 TaxID=2719615 RepID=UPI003FCD88F3
MNSVAILLIKFYQVFISKMLGEGKCRFEPSCSSYALFAFRKHKFIKAYTLSRKRFSRCCPPYGGVDYEGISDD